MSCVECVFPAHSLFFENEVLLGPGCAWLPVPLCPLLALVTESLQEIQARCREGRGLSSAGVPVTGPTAAPPVQARAWRQHPPQHPGDLADQSCEDPLGNRGKREETPAALSDSRRCRCRPRLPKQTRHLEPGTPAGLCSLYFCHGCAGAVQGDRKEASCSSCLTARRAARAALMAWHAVTT